MENNINFTYAEKQLILCLKQSFKAGSDPAVLKLITALKFKIPVFEVDRHNVFNFIVELFYKMKNYNLINITEKELFKREMFNRKGCISQKDMQDLFLTYIALSPVENIDLGKLEI